MIFINSCADDATTNDIIDWLFYYKKAFIRVNDTDKIIFLDLQLNGDAVFIYFMFNNVIYKTSDVSCYFYRRGFLNIALNKNSPLIVTPDEKFSSAIKNYLHLEDDSLINLFRTIIENRNPILSYSKAKMNKLFFLYVCKSLGIKTPKTAIVRTKEDLVKYKSLWGDLITKPITTGFFSDESKWFYTYTNEISKKDLENIESTFNDTLIQEKLSKLIEIRTFYFKGKIFSNAIFSQFDKQTSVDFRMYNKKNPNRNVPFNLPSNITNQVCKLMKELNLETGSLDIVLTKNKEYYFLEVNPVGQFAQVSMPSNYYIEQYIATQL